MTNLIPPTAKKQVKNEYWIRVASVWMMLVASGFLVVGIMFVPTLVLIQSQLDAFASEVDQANIQNESFVGAKATLVQANTIARTLSKESDTMQFTTLLEILETLAGAQVSINNFTFSKASGEISTISISGQAASRQALVSFSDVIEANDLFESAEIPLSTLAKDKDIPFTISVVPTKTNQ